MYLLLESRIQEGMINDMFLHHVEIKNFGWRYHYLGRKTLAAGGTLERQTTGISLKFMEKKET